MGKGTLGENFPQSPLISFSAASRVIITRAYQLVIPYVCDIMGIGKRIFLLIQQTTADIIDVAAIQEVNVAYRRQKERGYEKKAQEQNIISYSCHPDHGIWLEHDDLRKTGNDA